jgi:homoaconitase/3-isopropylmalate dehydratase large subunit
MAIVAGAFTGLIEPTIPEWKSDTDAEYEDEVRIDLVGVAPMIAEPSDPRNSVPLAPHHADVDVDIAYIDSCTSGKLTDLIACASVLKDHSVHPRVHMFVQASSRTIAAEAERLELIEEIKRAGATFLGPGCGACCGLGPGRSAAGEITISSTNRNFPGRMGKGDVYLANPAVVAASAVAGKIVSPARLASANPAEPA